jgi:hypothetical protein
LIVGAWGAESKIGKSYVIFGKTDSAVIYLSDIGIVGFQIIQAIAVNIACVGD